jgi:hypothetical protein
MNKVLERSKFDLDKTANRIKDRRFALEDKIRQAGIPIENIERIMRGFNRAYAEAVRHLESISLEALLDIELSLEAINAASEEIDLMDWR